MNQFSFFKNNYDAEACGLDCFNNAYYICMLILIDDCPTQHLSKYLSIALGKKKKNWDYFCAMTMGMVYNILYAYDNSRFSKSSELMKQIYNRFKEGSLLYYGAHFSFYNMIDDFDDGDKKVSIHDLMPRDIDNLVLNSKDLKKCLHLDNDQLLAIINLISGDDNQKKWFVRSLLERVGEKYGFMDSKVCANYKFLYELRFELTGEPTPQHLAFEDDSYCPPLVLLQSSQLQDTNKKNDSEIINKLEKENKALKDKIERMKQNEIIILNSKDYEISQIKAKYKNEVEQKKIDLQSNSEFPRTENKDLNAEIERLTLDLDGMKKENKGLLAHQAAIFILTICHELNQMPNQRESLAPILQYGWGFTESTSKKALRRAITKDEADKLAKQFDTITPKIARLIKELPQQLKEENDQRLRGQNKKG